MANEAVIVELLGDRGDVIQYTCADGTLIPKGTLLEMEDNRTVKAMSATDKPIAGIAAMEKVASDGSTTISVYTNGIFNMNCGTTNCTFGTEVTAEGAGNSVKDADTADMETGDVLGYAMESATSGQSVQIKVKK